MSAVPQSLGLAPGPAWPWPRDCAALLLCLGLLLLLYRQTAASMLAIWLRSDTFAHGLLVLPIALWLVWRQRGVLALQPRRPAPLWLLLVALAGLAWLLGELALVQTLSQAALVALLVLSVPLLLGTELARSIAFPLAFVFFAVPVGEFLLPQLMDWTAQVTVFALRASGIPVLRAGNSFVIPSGSWSVVEACSGVRYLIASFMLGTLFAYLNYRSARRRWLFVAASLLLPVLANWLRAYLIVLLGHLSGNRLATGVDHLLYGWLFFGLVMALMFMLGARWAEPPARPASADTHWWSQPQPLALTHSLRIPSTIPISIPTATDKPSSPGTALAPRLWASVLGLVLLAALPQLALWAMQRQAQALGARHAAAAPAGPALAAGWVAVGGVAVGGAGALEPAYQNPSRLWHARYVQGPPGAQTVGLYVAQYLQQERGHTLVGSGNALLASKDARWTVAARGRPVLELGGQSVSLRSSSLQSARLLGATEQATLEVWQLYWVHGRLTSSEWLAKLYGVQARLTGHSDDAAVLLVYADSAGAVAQFWRDNFDALNGWLTQQQGPGQGPGPATFREAP